MWLLAVLLPSNDADYHLLLMPLFLVPAAYIVASSLFLATVYSREVLTKRQEAMAWTVPWLVGVALWSWVIIGVAFENTVASWLGGFVYACIVATLCYLPWQIVALVIRQAMAWRSRGPHIVAESSGSGG